MAKRGRHPHDHKRRGRQGGGRRQAHPAAGHRPGAGDLLADVRMQLAGGEPLDFLAYVSALLAAVDPRGEDPFGRDRDGPERATLPVLTESFAEVALPETTALLAALSELAPDELTRARARRALAARADPLPDWLARLGETSVHQAVLSTHVLGDGDNVLLGARLPGHELTAVVYIDHNLGTVVKDAFPVPRPITDVVAGLRAAASDPDISDRELGLADARARVAQAIEAGARTFPPLETETWPMSRPLTEWLLRLLPGGGTGYTRPRWGEAAKAKLAARFFGSGFGKPFGEPEHRDLLEAFLWFGTDYGPGDPLRWSPVAVEILLADWIPRKIVASPEYLGKAPELLRAFIGFCHAERGIRPSLTGETLAAVGEHEPEYQRVIRSARPQGPAALLASLGLPGGEGLLSSLGLPGDGGVPGDGEVWQDEPFDAHQYLLEQLAQEAGGPEALGRLDSAALPEEEFRWEQVPAQARDRVAEVLAACDRCADDVLGAEYKTACRRLLARAVPGLSRMLSGTARPEAIAAAVCWVIGKGNHRLGQGAGEVRVKDLTGYLGLGQPSVSERGYQVMRAAGMEPASAGPALCLGTPSLLVSARRKRIIELRDLHRAAIAGQDRA